MSDVQKYLYDRRRGDNPCFRQIVMGCVVQDGLLYLVDPEYYLCQMRYPIIPYDGNLEPGVYGDEIIIKEFEAQLARTAAKE